MERKNQVQLADWNITRIILDFWFGEKVITVTEMTDDGLGAK